MLRTEITKSHLNKLSCQHCGVKTSTVTSSFHYVFNLSLSCTNSNQVSSEIYGGFFYKRVTLSSCLAGGMACGASVPVQNERNSGRAKEFFTFGRAKNGARTKRWKEGGGGGETREPRSWANGFFKIERFAGKRSLLSPPPLPSFHLFVLAPFFARPERENSFVRPEFCSPRTGTLATQATGRRHSGVLPIRLKRLSIRFETNRMYKLKAIALYTAKLIKI